MRSVIIFALLALALCQNPLTDALSGFTTKLGLTVDQTNDANVCLTGLIGQIQSLAPVYMDYVNKDIEALVTDAATFVEGFEPAVQSACQPFVQDMETYTVTFGNGQAPKLNLAINGAYFAQQLAIIVQKIEQQDFVGLGETIAYIYQIAVGAVDLDTLLPQQLTLEQAQALQQNAARLIMDQEAATEFLTAYVNGLGVADQVNVTALAQLIGESQQILIAIMTLESEINNGTYDSDITSIENFVTAVLEVVRNNQQGLESIVAIDAPAVHAFARNPVMFLARTIYNACLNAPEIVQNDNQLQNSLIAGDFATAGTIAAEIDIAYYGQLYGN